mgnify:FL=1
MIIHITGAPGSGKTTLGKKLSKIKKNNVIILDTDTIFDDFMFENKYKFSSVKYQKFLNNIIRKYKKKNIIFVGLNMDKGHTHKLYNLYSTHNIYVDIDLEVLLERLFYREVRQINANRKLIWRDYTNDPEGTCSKLVHNININELKKETKRFDIIYAKKGYQKMSIGDIKRFLRKIKLVK